MKSTSLHRIALALNAALMLTAVLTVSASEAPAKPAPTVTNAPPKLGVKQLLQSPSDYIGKTVVLEGFVTDYCKRKGCWALLHDTDPDAKGLIRAKQDESAGTYKAFPAEVQGKTVLVTGEVHGTKIDKDYLDKWEARVKAAQEKNAKADDKNSEEVDSAAAPLKQIAGFRERIAKTTNGYLTSISFAVAKWELPSAKK